MLKDTAYRLLTHNGVYVNKKPTTCRLRPHSTSALATEHQPQAAQAWSQKHHDDPLLRLERAATARGTISWIVGFHSSLNYHRRSCWVGPVMHSSPTDLKHLRRDLPFKSAPQASRQASGRIWPRRTDFSALNAGVRYPSSKGPFARLQRDCSQALQHQAIPSRYGRRTDFHKPYQGDTHVEQIAMVMLAARLKQKCASKRPLVPVAE